MIILGIDPGSAIAGYAIIKKDKTQKCGLEVIDFGCIITDKSLPTGERLEKTYNEILKIIKKYKPDLISIESLYFFKNMKTIIPVGQAKGVILLAASQKRIPVIEFTPLQIKMTIAGYGRAEKKQIQAMIEKTFDLTKFDMKKNNRKKDDAFDALGVAFCACFKNF
jgi:crossover junction endodeoxyribonuclease RuvC